MSIIPEWAPNVHPLIVHFPIALLFVAALLDTIGLFLKSQDTWKTSALVLYVLGALAAVAALFSGKQAADSVFLATEANALLTNHADMAHYVVYFFGGFALLRLIFFFTKLNERSGIRFVMYVLGLGGLVLVWATADRGAQMVFKYGVGVEAVDAGGSMIQLSTDSSATSAPISNGEGGWAWKPTRVSAWISEMTLYGDAAVPTTSIQDGGEHGDVLGLSTSGEPMMMTFDFPMQTLQMDTALNMDDFDGTVMFVHHVIDDKNYHFTSISKTEMKLGKSENGDLFLMDSKPFSPKGWTSYRVVVDQTHFRSYADQQLISHGHGDDPGSGVVGLRLNGSGTVLLDYMQTVSLRGEGMTAGAEMEATAEDDHDH